jgi:hypothetical protein
MPAIPDTPATAVVYSASISILKKSDLNSTLIQPDDKMNLQHPLFAVL